MTDRAASPEPIDLARQLRWLVDRYHRMSHSMLIRPGFRGTDRATAGRELAARLAEYAQGIEEHDRGQPNWRQVPDVGPLSVGDQIAVTGHDLITAYRLLPDSGTPVWTREDRQPADVVLRRARDLAEELRRAL